MRKFLWSFFEVIETVAIAGAAVILVRTFVAQPFLVSGSSMEPTFSNGNYLLVDQLSYFLRSPARGEVIVFKYPGDHRSYYIKRIIGLPNEKVVIENGTVTVYSGDNKLMLKEVYIKQGKTTGNLEFQLGMDQYFVMGDNRNFSYDSRSWGALKRSEIVGMARFRLWPINKVMAFSAPNY